MERLGSYVLLEKVATGGMAELYKAKKVGIEGFERVLAVKKILPHLSSDEEFINMFISEAKLAARLNHKNIAQIYDFGKAEENYFISMEYVRGKDLKAILKKISAERRKMPVAIAVFIAKEVAAALDYAHKQKDDSGKELNIIHRDISPQNILISYDGDVKIIDFGIAKASSHSKTTTGMLKGKLSYMSPEQASGKALDHRSDIFSLGVVLYEMLTGRKLFKGDSEIGTLEMIKKAKVEPLPSALNMELPEGLESKVLRALAREASERYLNASDMELDLWSEGLKLTDGNPTLMLKRYMNDLFRSEIESEQMSEKIASLKIEKEEGISPISPIGHIEEAAPEKPKKEKKEKPPKPVKASMPRRKGSFSCIIFFIIVVLIIAGITFMFPSYKAKVMPYALDIVEKITDLYQSQFREAPEEKPVLQDTRSRDIVVEMKGSRTLLWADYFEEGNNYCTNEPHGKFCVPKDDVVSIKKAKK